MKIPSPEESVAAHAAPRPKVTSNWMVVVVMIVVAVLAMALWSRPQSVPRTTTSSEREITADVDAATPSDGAAWPGEIETHVNELLPPEGYVELAECNVTQEVWAFNGRDIESILTLARTAGVPTEQVTRMRSLARCYVEGCTIMPDASLIESMTVEARTALYRELQRFPANRMQAFPSSRPVELGRWSEIPGISPQLRELFARSTWREPDRDNFSDQPWLCRHLATDSARLEALRVLYRRYALDAWVRVPPTGDIEPMVRYWKWGSPADEVRRTLLRAREGDGRVPVGALLPVFARTRLNRFPSPSDPEYDCFWTSMHFFDAPEPPDDRPGHEGIMQLLLSAYREVPMSEARFGDMIAQFSTNGVVVHTVNLVAGDVVFTKNGLDRSRPWVLQSLDYVRRAYPFTTLRYYRQR